jgi:two-component system response regulator VicR
MSDQPCEARRKIVSIEDEEPTSDLLKLVLTKEGFEVTCAASGIAGLDLITEARPDLVLLDLMMPDIDGWVVYQTMKGDEAMKHIPVIVVTARARSIDKVLGISLAKVDDYITKPFTLDQLVQSVNRVLGKGDAGQSVSA